MAGLKIDNRAKVKDTIVAHLTTGAYQKDACAAAGISVDTLAIWQKNDSEFSERCSRAREAGWIADLELIRQAAIAGDWRAAAERLDRTGSPYRKSQDINLNVNQIRAKAEAVAAKLGVPVEDVIDHLNTIAPGTMQA